MSCDFDQIIDRRHTDSDKWRYYDEDVIPLWVADMDFTVPEPVIRALEERVAHGIFGYGLPPDGLCEVIQEHLARLYGWRVETDEIFFLPGVVTGFNLVCHAIGAPGDEVLVEPPVYWPMLSAPGNNGRICKVVPLVEEDGRYEHDFDGFERAILDTDTGRTSLLLLCNPHNPVGRAFETIELERLAEICRRRGRGDCLAHSGSFQILKPTPHAGQRLGAPPDRLAKQPFLAVADLGHELRRRCLLQEHRQYPGVIHPERGAEQLAVEGDAVLRKGL